MICVNGCDKPPYLFPPSELRKKKRQAGLHPVQEEKVPRESGAAFWQAERVGERVLEAIYEFPMLWRFAVTTNDIVLLPLSRAVLCADCSVVSNATSDLCPACASPSLLNLGVVLGRSETPVEEVVFDA